MKLSWQKKVFQTGAEYLHVPILRIIYILLAGLLFCGVVFSVWFIYRSVFAKIEEANSIILLRSEIGIETLQFELFEKVRDSEEKRINNVSKELLKNPFVSTTLLPEISPTTQSEI